MISKLAAYAKTDTKNSAMRAWELQKCLVSLDVILLLNSTQKFLVFLKRDFTVPLSLEGECIIHRERKNK